MKAILPQSIRWRIQAWHGVLLVGIVAGLIIGFYHYERMSRYREVDSLLHQSISPLLPQLAPIGGGGGRDDGPPERGRRRPPREIENTFEPPPRPGPMEPRRGEPVSVDVESRGLYYIAWGPDDRIYSSSANAPLPVPTPGRSEISRENPLRTRGDFRELIHFVPNGQRVLLGTSTARIKEDLNRLALWLGAAGLAVVALGLAGGWFMAGRAIRPINDISAAAQRIAGGDLSKRISVTEAESELGQLGRVLNDTFDKLEKNFEQQIRFTADASHELRTPIAVMLTQIQLALSRERTPREYQQTLATCERAAERMRSLVNQLLELARVDSGEFELNREACDLEKIAQEALEFVQPLAEQKKMRITSSLSPIHAQADALKLSQVLINLLTNAIQHNEEGIEICLSSKREGDQAIIRVTDNGIGVPPEALPHLFERFYRVDKSRSRTKGNSGLGLAICKAVVEAHKGSIHAESAPGHGAAFTIRIPLN